MRRPAGDTNFGNDFLSQTYENIGMLREHVDRKR